MVLNITEYGGSGSRVVFLHGLFGQGRNWTQFGKALAAAHRVQLVDLPDHGRSDWTVPPPEGRGFDLVEVADTIAGELGDGGADPIALIGHSLGGKIAMLVALRHPALVERLCVVDVAPVVYGSATEFAGYIEAMRSMDLDALDQRADADAALAGAVPNPTVRSFLLSNLRRDTGADGASSWRWQPNLAGLARDLDVITSWPDDRLDGTAPYPGPVLWLGGERSDYITDAYAGAMDALFPHNRRVTVKNAGHWVHSEQPEVFGQVMELFLR